MKITQNKLNEKPLWLFLIIGLCVYGAVLYFQPWENIERILLGRNDFIQLYAGAKLVGTLNLYNGAALEQIQIEEAGMQSENIHYTRLPFYAFLLQPLTWLPYRAAYTLFQTINLLCFFWFLWQFIPASRELAAFASISLPLYAMLENGQDVGLLLFLASSSVVLARRNLDFCAGLVLSLCAIKPHLFVLMPVVMILQRRWLILFGNAVGGVALLAVSFAVGGWNWPYAYWLNLAGQTKNLDYMSNIHTVSAQLGSGPLDFAVEIFLSACVVVITVFLALKIADYELAFTFGLIGSMLISFHSYTQDCLLLLLPLAIVLSRPVAKSVRSLTELVASPIANALMLVGTPFNIVMPCLLGGILVLSARNLKSKIPSPA
jgi:hypothetical protein